MLHLVNLVHDMQDLALNCCVNIGDASSLAVLPALQQLDLAWCRDVSSSSVRFAMLPAKPRLLSLLAPASIDGMVTVLPMALKLTAHMYRWRCYCLGLSMQSSTAAKQSQMSC